MVRRRKNYLIKFSGKFKREGDQGSCSLVKTPPPVPEKEAYEQNKEGIYEQNKK
jgi:hypothetical protein